MSVHLASYRKYRPQRFCEVIGQQSSVTILKNAVILQKTTHSYLFCGTRGTGKTTLARLFAKALNCLQISEEGEPCNSCLSCKEIIAGNGLDVLEIDGASHRGIDDIKQINETVFFSPSHAKFKIYIIDEVHMLTKEAFNALLKTLEEPPSHVKFFLATTEPHKIPSTILSRCQKLSLNRIPETLIAAKLITILADMELSYEENAVKEIARAAQGSLRDAESLFDLVASYSPEFIGEQVVRDTLGLPDIYVLSTIDKAIISGDYINLFKMINSIFERGYDWGQFLNALTLYYRDLLLGSQNSGYSEEQLLYITEFLGEASFRLKQTVFERVFVETVLLHVMNYRKRPSISELFKLKTVSETTDNEPSFEKLPNHTSRKTRPVNTVTTVKSPIEASRKKAVSSDDIPKPMPPEESEPSPQENVIFDTVLQFGAVEFQGVLSKK